MADDSGRDPLKAQIYERMNEKDTDELVAIWKDNNPDEWTPAAFEAVKAILVERLGELPERTADEDELDDEGVEDEERTIIRYPSDKKLIRLADLSTWLSRAVLVVVIVLSVLRIWNVLIGGAGAPGFSSVLIFVINETYNIMFGVFLYVVLQGVAEIIYLLMDIRDKVNPEDVDASLQRGLQI